LIAVSFPSFHLIPCSPFRFFNCIFKCLLHLYLLCLKIAHKVFLPGFILVRLFAPGLCSHFIVLLFPFIIMSSYCKLFIPEHYHPLAWPLRKKSILHLAVSRWLIHSWASVTSKSSTIPPSLILESLPLNHCYSC